MNDKHYWENVHKEGYEKDVWSLTQDKVFQEKILEAVAPYKKNNILVPGCGSLGIIEQHLVDHFDDIEQICGVDFPEVVACAEKRSQSSKITYAADDMLKTDYFSGIGWDLALSINSILSNSHEANRKLLNYCKQALKEDGVFVGFFPTVFATLDIAYAEGNEQRLESIDLNNSIFKEPLQQVEQIFYTPLGLRKLFKEVGLKLEKMEIFFCEGEESKMQSYKHYGIEDDDLLIYELVVVATHIE